MVLRKIGNYEIIEEIGEGGMEIVYKAKQAGLERIVALKVLLPNLSRKGKFVERFMREARSAAKLEHPNIVTIYEVGQDGDSYYFSMNYVEGEDLSAALSRGPIELDKAVDVITQIAEGLAKAHKEGVVHRDIKPANVILDKEGRAVITDFGIARAAWEEKLTTTGMSMGTIEYMSPEQFEGSEDLDSRSDIYSLGATFYRMVTGVSPFPGETTQKVIYKKMQDDSPPPTQVLSSLPDWVDAVVAKAMAKGRGERYGSALEFADALKAGLGGKAVKKGKPKRPEEKKTVIRESAGLRDEPTTVREAGAEKAPAKPVSKKSRNAIIAAVVGSLGIGILAIAVFLFLVLTRIGIFAGGDKYEPMFKGNPARTGSYKSSGEVPTGDLLWKFKTGGKIESSPAVNDGVVYVGSEDSHFYALDAKTGEERWRFKTISRINYSSPCVSGKSVYFGDDSGRLYSVNIKTGEERWKFWTGGAIFSSPCVVSDVVLFCSANGRTYCLDAKTGSERWKYRTGERLVRSPAVSDGIVYFGGWDDYLYAVDVETGNKLWDYKTNKNITSAPCVLDSVVYFINKRYFFALDSKTGAKLFKLESFSDTLYTFSSPGGAKDTVYYYGGLSSCLYAVDSKTGEERWKFEMGACFSSSPCISPGVVYIGSKDKCLYAIDTDTGEEQWRFRAEGEIDSTPTVVDGVVYFGSSDGYLYALE